MKRFDLLKLHSYSVSVFFDLIVGWLRPSEVNVKVLAMNTERSNIHNGWWCSLYRVIMMMSFSRRNSNEIILCLRKKRFDPGFKNITQSAISSPHSLILSLSCSVGRSVRYTRDFSGGGKSFKSSEMSNVILFFAVKNWVPLRNYESANDAANSRPGHRLKYRLTAKPTELIISNG